MQNQIISIQNEEGTTVEGTEEIAKVFVRYYSKILGTKTETLGIEDSIIKSGKILNLEQQMSLVRPFNSQQVKEVLFSIPTNKSPGLDGYGSGFFKGQWNVGELVTKAVLDFFKEGQTLRQVNATNLTLLPKVTDPKWPSEYRPIACCNTIYKVISKLISMRLREVLPDIVDLNQGAFVQERELIHNILICQEIAKGYNRKNFSARCMMKLDIQKAYESVDWKAIKGILHSLMFPDLFIKWVMFCISTPTYTLSINGGRYGYIKGAKGLRQGTQYLHCYLCW
ncbi:unnamed protein product [Cuscuta campestris]|uniref:Reverse transcriptase domain-containing protein n=1 Tax=Cuscuta campestris TaxID=132261 RepID=A0A484L2D7_9ASTE|nr:unnamed protein product [Cuscuta campestris]